MAKRFSSSKGPSQRQLRAGELIRHALVEILQREDLRDPRLSGVSVTISEVRPSPDLRQATVYCAPLGRSTDTASTVEIVDALNRCAAQIRGVLGRKVDLKFTPALVFRPDETFAEADRIETLLRSDAVRRDISDE